MNPAQVHTARVDTAQVDTKFVTPPPSDYNLELTLQSGRIDALLQGSAVVPLVRFVVWGYDELAADTSATQIATDTFALRPQTVAYPLRFKAGAFDAIELRSGNDDALKFYVTLAIDINGDGVICNGDMRQDFTVARPKFHTLAETEIERVIEVADINGEVCETR